MPRRPLCFRFVEQGRNDQRGLAAPVEPESKVHVYRRKTELRYRRQAQRSYHSAHHQRGTDLANFQRVYRQTSVQLVTQQTTFSYSYVENAPTDSEHRNRVVVNSIELYIFFFFLILLLNKCLSSPKRRKPRVFQRTGLEISASAHYT